MKKQTNHLLKGLLIFVMLALIPLVSSQSGINFESKTLISEIDFGHNLQDGFFITLDGGTLFTVNGTDIFEYDIPEAYDLTSVNNATPNNTFNFGVATHNIHFYIANGKHMYLTERGTNGAGTNTGQGTLRHYELTNDFDLSTAVLKDSSTFGIADTLDDDAGRLISDISINFLGKRLYVLTCAQDDVIAPAEQEVVFEILEYDLITPYFVASKTLLNITRLGNFSIGIGSAVLCTETHPNVGRSAFQSIFFREHTDFIWSINSTSISSPSTFVTFDQFFMNSWDLSSATRQQQFNETFAYSLWQSDDRSKLFTLGNANFKSSILTYGLPPFIDVEVPDQTIALNTQKTIANVAGCCSSVASFDTTVQIVDTKTGNSITLEPNDTVQTFTIAGIDYSNFTLTSGLSIIIKTFAFNRTFEVSNLYCTNNFTSCAADNYIITVTDSPVSLASTASIQQQKQDLVLSYNDAHSFNFSNYFNNFDDVLTISNRIEPIDLRTGNRLFVPIGGVGIFNDDSDNLIFNVTFRTNLEVILRSGGIDRKFNVSMRACDDSNSCVSQNFTVTITGNPEDLLDENIVIQTEGGRALGSFVVLINKMFPDADTISIRARFLYVFVAMSFITALILLSGWAVKDEVRGVGGITLWLALMFDIVIFFFFVSIDYVPIALVISSLLVVGLIVVFRFWRGGGG